MMVVVVVGPRVLPLLLVKTLIVQQSSRYQLWVVMVVVVVGSQLWHLLVMPIEVVVVVGYYR